MNAANCAQAIAQSINNLFKCFQVPHQLVNHFYFKPSWKSYHHFLHCNNAFFSFSADDDVNNPGPAKFDTDSFPVGADVCASATLCNKRNLFTDLEAVQDAFLKGVGGKIPVVGKGTLHLSFEDDQANLHTFKIKDACYVPDLPMTLLCP